MADTRSDRKKAKDAIKYCEYLAEVRKPFESMVDNIITYVNHSRRKISDKGGTKGQKTGTQVYDGTALSAKNLLVDGMVGYLCSRSIRWFAFTLPGRLNFPRTSMLRRWNGKNVSSHPDIRYWLQGCEEVQYAALNRSNFYDVIPSFIGDGATAGTAHLLAEEDPVEGRVIFTAPHFRECFIAENRHGAVDTNYRKFDQTLRQLVDRFGMDVMVGADRNFKNSYASNMHEVREVLHATYPSADYDPSRIDRGGKRFSSLWVYGSIGESAVLLEEGGYYSLPIVTWRWDKNSDEWYGRSPSWNAYVDILTANQQGRTNLIAGHKMVEPPMVGQADLRGRVNSGPGGWTWMDTENLAENAPRPLMTGIELPYGTDMQERTERVIRDHFAVDFFLMLTQASINKVELTATQVIEMMGEKAAVLGTRVGRFQSEAMTPVHSRVFDIEDRAGRMPEPPSMLYELGEGRVEVQYLGPLAQVQNRLSKIRSINAGLQMIGGVAQMVGPAALDRVDVDAVIDELFDASGFPASCIRDELSAARIRDARAKNAERQQQIDAIPKLARALEHAGVKTEEGSPLKQLMAGLVEGGEGGQG